MEMSKGLLEYRKRPFNFATSSFRPRVFTMMPFLTGSKLADKIYPTPMRVNEKGPTFV